MRRSDDFDTLEDLYVERVPQRPVKRRRKKPIRVPGIIITLLLFVMSIEFVAMLWTTQMFPDYILISGGLILITLDLIIFLFIRNMRKKVPFIIGFILALLMASVMILGNFYILTTVNVLSKISGISTRTSEIGIYVRTDDPAETIEDAMYYNFAVMTNLDASSTQEAVLQLNEILGVQIQTTGVGGVMEVAEALLSGEYDAIILNQAYIDVLADIEEYADIQSRVRKLDSVSVVVEEQEIEEGQKEELGETLQIYVSGVDTRDMSITNSRSDVNIIATVNIETKQVLLVSTPRDYFVPLSISDGVPDKLTHAGIYGIDCSMDTLSMLYDADVDNYFRVNFAGFVDIIDALGGVDVYSDQSFTSELAEGTYQFDEGMNHLNGAAALSFARERHAFADGDRARGRHQMEVIRAVMDKAMTPEILRRYTAILKAVEGCFETDISYSVIADIVKLQLSDSTPWHIVSYSVNGSNGSERPYSLSTQAYVMIPDMDTVEHAKSLMQQVIDGEILPDDVSDVSASEE